MKRDFANHIFTQSEEEIKSFLGMNENFYNLYINTLNNEKETYRNVEDSRTASAKKFVETHELSLNLNNDTRLHIGGCKRQNYLKMYGFIGLPRSASELDAIEKNELMKKQLLRRFELSKVLISPKSSEVAEINGLELKGEHDGIVYDFVNDKEYTLLIKPVNDSAFSIKNQLFGQYRKPTVMDVHMAEVFGCLLVFKKPVKLIYVGKNYSNNIVEFNIGMKSQNIYINDEVAHQYTIDSLLSEIGQYKYAFENGFIPNRDYPVTYLEVDTEVLLANGILSDYDCKDLKYGKQVQNFRCNSCQYKNYCDAIGINWVKNEYL
jgi:hypothetical protein